jgi:hypothetical protein
MQLTIMLFLLAVLPQAAHPQAPAVLIKLHLLSQGPIQ